MPANLTAEAKAKWQQAQAAKNLKEKLLLFQEFLSLIPKHKGNERLRAQTKTKIAQLKQDIVVQRGRKAGGRTSWTVERVGSVQVMLYGPTNVGRSSLLSKLTNAQPPVATYEYTTQRPIPGMLQFEDIQIQLVELPAPQIGSQGTFRIQPEMSDLVRSSDALMLVVDLSNNPFSQLSSLIASLEDIHVSTLRTSSRVEIIPEKGSGEIRIATAGVQQSKPAEKIRELLHSYGIRNALVRIYGEVTLDDVEDAILENVTIYKPTIVVANKLDLRKNEETTTELAEKTSLPSILTSCLTCQGLPQVAPTLFRTLDMVRVYTKEPNETKPSEHPFVVRTGTTVKELARNIHTDLAERYRYSRIWGPTSKFPGERVGPDHILGDQDVVEIHIA
ncbi:MAG TPA: GTPase [Candidatus Acidoferrales bacterium]|nr:GTPase [Candidatus Acidoferrales bacterium]